MNPRYVLSCPFMFSISIVSPNLRSPTSACGYEDNHLSSFWFERLPAVFITIKGTDGNPPGLVLPVARSKEIRR